MNVLVCVDEIQQKNIIERAILTQDIASLTKRRAVMIVEDSDSPLTQNIPTFTVDELNQMKKAFDLVKNWVKKYADIKES